MTGKLLLTLIVLLSVFSLNTNAQNTETAKYMHVSDVSLLRDGDEVIIVRAVLLSILWKTRRLSTQSFN